MTEDTKVNKRAGEKKETSVKQKASSTKRAKKSIPKTNELNAKIELLTSELNDLKDKYLRTIAEFNNFKKRKERDFVDVIERANREFCLELLPVLDDFGRSLNTSTAKKNYKSLRNGIELIFQKLSSALKRQGVEPIEAIGQPFDPQIHEAIFQVVDTEKPSNVVVDEATKGYRYKDKVLRFSKVVVNK
ncbi:MAG TPA: nucleotide exchange factor GrpE [bacterium]